MKKERYIVEIEMPEGDATSTAWVCDTLQSESDIEDEGRWKVSVKEYCEPNDEQLDALHDAAVYVDKSMFPYPKGILMKLYKQLKSLKG